ncbi:MAG: translation initiation factor IF-2 [Variovorax sp.]|nr:MAG: translation initiation factor IF-2 [Variovorax sp.]
MPVSLQSLFAGSRAIGLVACVAMTCGGAWAQATGNPKGTGVPSAQGTAEKAPAGGRPAGAGATSSGALTSESGPASARMNRTVPPGGGTAGGLTQRNLTAPEDASKSRTDKGSATPRPVTPSSPGGAR